MSALLDHLNWSPPAIVQPAPVVSATDEKLAGYAAYVGRQEDRLAAWIEKGVRLREELWRSARNPDFDPETLPGIIDQFESGLEEQARILARREKEARRDEKGLSEPLKSFVVAQHSRLLKVGRAFYGEGRDFASFLRALSVELDPSSRGGPTFADAATMREYLLKSLG